LLHLTYFFWGQVICDIYFYWEKLMLSGLCARFIAWRAEPRKIVFENQRGFVFMVRGSAIWNNIHKSSWAAFPDCVAGDIRAWLDNRVVSYYTIFANDRPVTLSFSFTKIYEDAALPYAAV
jgi:hypothetical protein